MTILLFTIMYIAFIVGCASVVPICQYVYTMHIHKHSKPVYKFSIDLFERHIHTPTCDWQKIRQEEYDIPLP